MLKVKASRLTTKGEGATLALDGVANCIPFDKGIDFGYVCVGKSLTKTISLQNFSATS
jgi:hypothetical protein